MKVYVVIEQSSWHWSYADHGDCTDVRCVCLTKEKAEEKIHEFVAESEHSHEFIFERDEEDGSLYAFLEEDNENLDFYYDEMEVEE